ncbi:MAG: hypothetical protein H0U27_07250 [Nitrosopumilus sp.]|nr:hypothetical protein [Nitrosopumilus sp.]MBA3971742.1 hypothetical protein [Bacteroidota bacterium]
MPIKLINTIEAVKIVREVGTKGSSPLVVMDKMGNEYYTKTSTLNKPRSELINEVFCAFALQLWKIEVPSIFLIKIPYYLVERYNDENVKSISARYTKAHFDDTLFFGSANVGTTVEVLDFLPGITKPQFKKLYRPEDLLKIGVFDLWVGNKDRKPDNPNFLLIPVQSKIGFCAIDHTAAFVHISNYQEVRDIMLRMERNFSILATPLAKDILQYLPQKDIEKLKNELQENIDRFNAHYDQLVDYVPNEWGFSGKAKAHLKIFFQDTERNKRIINSFINY